MVFVFFIDHEPNRRLDMLIAKTPMVFCVSSIEPNKRLDFLGFCARCSSSSFSSEPNKRLDLFIFGFRAKIFFLFLSNFEPRCFFLSFLSQPEKTPDPKRKAPDAQKDPFVLASAMTAPDWSIG